MNNDIKTRITNYISNNPDKKEYIKGARLESGVIILKNGTEVSINDLENGTFDWTPIIQPVQQAQPVQTAPVQPMPAAPQTQTIVQPEIPVAPVQNTIPTINPDPVQVQPQVEMPTNNVVPPVNANVIPEIQNQATFQTTLQDVKTLFELSAQDPNNKLKLDGILSSFATNEQGVVDIGKAISTVTNNSEELVVNSILANKGLPIELYKYTPAGKLVSETENYPFTDVNGEIEKVFNNVLIYANNVSVYGMMAYNQDIITSAKNSFVSSVNKKLTERGYVPVPKEVVTPTNVAPVPPVVENNLNTIPEVPEEKAGFADIFILVLIVAVYAVIIVNLIMKIK